MIFIRFESGSLILTGDTVADYLADYVRFDDRISAYRARALDYGPIVRLLHGAGIDFTDNCKAFKPLVTSLQSNFEPRDYQQLALDRWYANKGRGVVVLPTGAGKSFVAQLAIDKVKRSALVVVPTIDLMLQWHRQLEDAFACKIGLLGGGYRELEEITISTYDSAVLQMEFIGNHFGLIIFDECHHLPGAVNRQAALMAIAPYRLGLSATPERADGGDDMFAVLIGPEVFRIEVDALEGSVLATYKTEQIYLSLTPDEAHRYQQSRSIYTSFLRQAQVDFNSGNGWQNFIIATCRNPGGKDAFKAYMEQKRIAQTASSKIETIWDLLKYHSHERIIIFTADNETAYHIGKSFCLPVITHQTKAAERKGMLNNFRSGSYSVLVTSKVLNEGIDVPDASIGIVVSGSGSTREHVQRLGRILRPKAGKQATLYELISTGTSEENTSERRRQHRAYIRKDR